MHILLGLYFHGRRTMMMPKVLTWNDRFALIDKFKPEDAAIPTIFGITDTELNVARSMRKVGILTPAINIDYASYAAAFNSTLIIDEQHIMEIPEIVSPVAPLAQVPETATRTQRKRGRKGSNIATAFKAITTTPVEAGPFAVQYAVSLAVLRQGKRFDPHPELGTVKVKKHTDTKVLMIWRDINNG